MIRDGSYRLLIEIWISLIAGVVLASLILPWIHP
jgi:hypothetical protein